MSKKSIPQYAKVEQPFGCDPPIVHCPICGNPSITIGDQGGELTPCMHLVFLYAGPVGDFIYQSEDFKNRIKAVDEEELEEIIPDEFNELLEKAGYDNKLLAIEITHGGMACGPVWYTDVVGFDYGTLAAEKQS